MMPDDRQSSTRAASRVLIGVGSNQGDRIDNLREAALLLAGTEGVESLLASPVYETRPLGPVGPDMFLNAVFDVQTHLSPRRILRRLMDIESQLGRRTPRSGPRTIDLDILFYDDLVFESGDLIIPHPRLVTREFVLRPLSDIAPAFCHPEHDRSVAELLEALGPRDEVVRRWPESLGVEFSPLRS